MRLLFVEPDKAHEGRLQITLCKFNEDKTPPYAILSHRWREEEVLFDDMTGASSVSQQL
jgi:hypothetical protein